MLNSSALLRIGVLLIAAGLVAALVQALLPRGETVAEPPPPAQVEAAPTPEPPAADPEPVMPAPQPPAAAPAFEPAAPVPSAPVARPEVPPPGGQAASGAPTRPDGGVRADLPEAAPGAGPMGQAAVDSANDNAGPRALTLVDLNTASLAELNRLRGGGNIGRAIIQKRPYASVDQLLAKRVLSRATYDRIKDQVTVQ